MSLEIKKINVDLCVIGGGIAGMMCAISAARKGVKVALVHERPVYGGNASSEIRMWVCGTQNQEYKETGILEEINLENYYLNPTKNYYLWNTILNNKVTSEENIISLLNTTCFDAKQVGSNIKYIKAYQMTTQTIYQINATNFADCSGDSILASLTNAKYMFGREGHDEFNEEMKNHQERDNKTMGNSLLLQAREVDHKVEFHAPKWAEKISVEKLKSKGMNIHEPYENFWYIEIGGNDDCVKDAEVLSQRLLAICLGVWDTVKNSGEFDADNFELDFIGFLGAKRESKRMVGDYIMTENDIKECKEFEDAVAYGGWPMDDHNPDGLDGTVSNFYIEVPKTYGIPYRCLYSNNISNLFFAGRNISLTHMANSSARVMGTCSTLGSAIGHAAYISKKYNCTPREVLKHMDELQQSLLYDDNFIPNVTRKVSDLSSNTLFDGDNTLRNGLDRNIAGSVNNTQIENNVPVKYVLNNEYVNDIKIVFDSDLVRASFKDMCDCEKMHSTRCNQLKSSPVMYVPTTLAKEYYVSIILEDGSKEVLLEEKENIRRNIILPVNKVVKEIELTVVSNWGNTNKTSVFTFEIK